MTASQPATSPSTAGSRSRNSRSPVHRVPVFSSITVRSQSVWALGQARRAQLPGAQIEFDFGLYQAIGRNDLFCRRRRIQVARIVLKKVRSTLYYCIWQQCMADGNWDDRV